MLLTWSWVLCSSDTKPENVWGLVNIPLRKFPPRLSTLFRSYYRLTTNICAIARLRTHKYILIITIKIRRTWFLRYREITVYVPKTPISRPDSSRIRFCRCPTGTTPHLDTVIRDDCHGSHGDVQDYPDWPVSNACIEKVKQIYLYRAPVV